MNTHTSGAADLPDALRKGDCGFWQWHPEIHPQGDHSMQALTEGDKRYGWREAALAAGQAVAPAPAVGVELPAPDFLIGAFSAKAWAEGSVTAYGNQQFNAGREFEAKRIATRPAPPAMDGGEDAARHSPHARRFGGCPSCGRSDCVAMSCTRGAA
uniref:Uncharacterized protein n=1 Tax=viral metagenome TaxID=1070528 RepID=A0A6M3M447_9ZZZZ